MSQALALHPEQSDKISRTTPGLKTEIDTEIDTETETEVGFDVELDFGFESEIDAEIDPEVCWPPTDLWSDEPPLESDFHRDQIELLIQVLKWWWRDRPDGYVSGNLTIYYDADQIERRKFRGPDFFAVLGADKTERKSWMVWQEGGQYPNVIIEILSRSTAKVDKHDKKQLYQDVFRTPNYFWFQPNTLELKGFHLLDGQYEELQPNTQELLWVQQLDLFLGVHERRLRFFTPDMELIPTANERADQERQRADRERQRAEELSQELERLRAQMQAQGINSQQL